jgi:hypothetical protein
MTAKLTSISNKSEIKYFRSKKKAVLLYLISGLLLFGLLISPVEAGVFWKSSPSNPGVGDTLVIKGIASPGQNVRIDVSFEKFLPVSGGKYKYSVENIKIPGGDNRFTARAYGVKNMHLGVKKGIWVNLYTNSSGGVATMSKANVPSLSYDVVIDGNALKKSSPVYLKVTASKTLKADSKGKFEYSYDTSSMPAGVFIVNIGGSQKAIVLRSSGHGGGHGWGKEPVAAFSASPLSGKAPLKVQFTDRSINNPTSYIWNFGDGTYSMAKNPVHTYSRSGKYTVSLKVKNVSGTDTETKSKYITVSRK